MNEYTYNEISIGQEEKFFVDISKGKEDLFRELSGDTNPLHLDDNFAKEIKEGLKSHVSFGMLTASFYSTFAGVYLPGKYSLIHSVDIKFKEPVYNGDKLLVIGKVESKQDELKLILLDVKITNQYNKIVSKAKMKVLVLK